MAYKQTTGSISLKEKKSNTFITGGITVTDRNISSDAFDRLRVSNPTTLFEINSIFNKNHSINELISGSGTSVHDASNSYIQMALSDSDTGKVIRQSFEYIPYQPGKSRFMIFTGVLEVNGGVNGSISRIGSFDSQDDKTAVSCDGNGLFFELNGTTIYTVLRNNNVDTKTSQENWNIDTLNGSGPSGYTLNDWSKAYIFTIEQEWLGIGMVRFGIMINGRLIPVHIIHNTGIGSPSSTSINKPYTKMAKLPIRYEIQSTSAVNAEMRMICCTVLSEGGFEPFGYQFSYIRESVKTINTTILPVLSIKLKEVNDNEYNRTTVLLKSIHILNSNTSNKNAFYKLYILDNKNKLTGASWTDINSNSAVQIDISSTAIDLTNARYSLSGFVNVSNSENFDTGDYFNSTLLNSSINGTSRVLSLCCKSISGNIDVYASFDWIEIQ